MAHDQPPPAGRRGPLDDLRERLARLPDSHPASPGYTRSGAAPRGGADHGSGDWRGADPGGWPQTRAERDGADGGQDGARPGTAWAGQPAAARAAEAERNARHDRLRRIDRMARLLGPERDGGGGAARARGDGGQAPGGRAGDSARGPGAGPLGGPGALGGLGPLSGLGALGGPRRRDGYRPWFADADLPWFDPDGRG